MRERWKLIHRPVERSCPLWPLWSWCGVFGNDRRASLPPWFYPQPEVQPGRFWLAKEINETKKIMVALIWYQTTFMHQIKVCIGMDDFTFSSEPWTCVPVYQCLPLSLVCSCHQLDVTIKLWLTVFVFIWRTRTLTINCLVSLYSSTMLSIFATIPVSDTQLRLKESLMIKASRRRLIQRYSSSSGWNDSTVCFILNINC